MESLDEVGQHELIYMHLKFLTKYFYLCCYKKIGYIQVVLYKYKNQKDWTLKIYEYTLHPKFESLYWYFN